MSEAKKGEIAVFTRDHRLFAHRIVSHEGSRIVTQGDAVPSRDQPVNGTELLGVVESVSRNGMPARLPARLSVSHRLVAALVRRSSRAGAALQKGRALLVRTGVGSSDLGSRHSKPVV